MKENKLQYDRLRSEDSKKSETDGLEESVTFYSDNKGVENKVNEDHEEYQDDWKLIDTDLERPLHSGL
jgi:hypothetical protein